MKCQRHDNNFMKDQILNPIKSNPTYANPNKTKLMTLAQLP